MSSDLDIGCHMDFHFSESSNLTEPELDNGDGVGTKLDIDNNSDDVGQLLGSVSNESCDSSLQNPQNCSKHDSLEFGELGTSDLVTTSDFMEVSGVGDVPDTIMDSGTDSVGESPDTSSQCSATVCDMTDIEAIRSSVNASSVFSSCHAISNSTHTTPLSGARLVTTLSTSSLQSLPVCAESLQTVQVLPLEGLQTVQVVSAVNAATLQTMQVLSPHSVTGTTTTTLPSAVLIGNVLMLTPTTGLNHTLPDGALSTHPQVLPIKQPLTFQTATSSLGQNSSGRMTIKEALRRRSADKIFPQFQQRVNDKMTATVGTTNPVSFVEHVTQSSSTSEHVNSCSSVEKSVPEIDLESHQCFSLKETSCAMEQNLNQVNAYKNMAKEHQQEACEMETRKTSSTVKMDNVALSKNNDKSLSLASDSTHVCHVKSRSNESQDKSGQESEKVKCLEHGPHSKSDKNTSSPENTLKAVTYVSLLKVDKDTHKPLSPAPIMFQVCGKDGSVKKVHINPVDVQHGGSVAVVQGTSKISEKPMLPLGSQQATSSASSKIISLPAVTEGDIVPYRCDLCSATFNRMGNYTRHRMIHTVNTKDDYRYKCEECGRLFLQRCDMKRHMLIHSKQEPFKCSECGKAYIRRSDLVVHTRFHRQDKAFKCSYCEKSFYQTGDLNRHVRIVHIQTSMLTCGHCNRTYAREATLIRHMQTKHKDIIVQSLKVTGDVHDIESERANDKHLKSEHGKRNACEDSDIASSDDQSRNTNISQKNISG